LSPGSFPTPFAPISPVSLPDPGSPFLTTEGRSLRPSRPCVDLLPDLTTMTRKGRKQSLSAPLRLSVRFSFRRFPRSCRECLLCYSSGIRSVCVEPHPLFYFLGTLGVVTPFTRSR
jgi:hypothetical protein